METKVKTPSYKEGLKDLKSNLTNMLPTDALSVFDTDAEESEENFTDILKIQEGEIVDDFTLPNASGQSVNLNKLLEKSKVVLTFYRGTWCPYCNLQLAQYQKILPEITALGATLVAVSPQTPDESLNLKEKNELKFEVLSDVGNVVIRKFTKVFKYGDVPLNTMTDLGFNFDSHYGDDSREIPVPAVFIIDQDRNVIFA